MPGLKKILLLLVVAFIVYYVLHSPTVAGHSLHAAGSNTWHALKSAASSLTKFFDSLFR
ncbi:MAG TPA: hypothetical protein VHA57_08000 [Actinomycetota bacterium]|nr:hypothetical protein [Actinomycetota bacterium]